MPQLEANHGPIPHKDKATTSAGRQRRGTIQSGTVMVQSRPPTPQCYPSLQPSHVHQPHRNPVPVKYRHTEELPRHGKPIHASPPSQSPPTVHKVKLAFFTDLASIVLCSEHPQTHVIMPTCAVTSFLHIAYAEPSPRTPRPESRQPTRLAVDPNMN